MVEFFETVGDFISMLVDGIRNFFDIISNGVTFVQSFFVFLPLPLSSVLIAALTIMIAIAILKLI